jgi:beta-lactamase regulating signal transducer with metallopeptidase domain
MTGEWTTPVEVIGWTLLHFVWQGTLIALALGVLLFFLPATWARARYLVACTALVVMALAPLATAAAIARGETTLAAPAAWAAASPTPAIGAGETRDSAPAALGIVGAADRWLGWLVVAWAFGVLLSATRLAGGWWQARRLLRDGTSPVGPEWTTLVARLSRSMGVGGRVRLLRSARVHVPLVVGSVKPVLLLPAAALAGLSPQHVEAILAHELAHIRRHDYLVNLLQSAIETVLFYHPAVWWVSHTIRVEREHCCDDLAVRACGDPLLYARALTTLETLRGDAFGVAMAASNGSLLSRVRRILGQRTPAPVASSGWVVASLTAIMVAGAGAGGTVVDPARWMAEVAPAAEAIALTTGITGAAQGTWVVPAPVDAVQEQQGPRAPAVQPDSPEPPLAAPPEEARLETPSPEGLWAEGLEQTIEAAMEAAAAALETALRRVQEDPAVMAALERTLQESLALAERALRDAEPALAHFASGAVEEAVREASRELQNLGTELQRELGTLQERTPRMREEARERRDEARQTREQARRDAVHARDLHRRARLLAAEASRLSARAARMQAAGGEQISPERLRALETLAQQLSEQARAIAAEARQLQPAAPRTPDTPRAPRRPRSPRPLAPAVPPSDDVPAPPAPPAPPALPAPAAPPAPSVEPAPPLPPAVAPPPPPRRSGRLLGARAPAC